MNDNRAIVYFCSGTFHVLVATMMAELKFGEYKNLAIMEKVLSDKLYLDQSDICFDNIYGLSQIVSGYEIDSVLQKIYNEYDVIYAGLFTWGGHGNEFYKRLKPNIPVLLLDEGMYTYNYKHYMTFFVHDLDFSKISEVWMLDPSISQNDKMVPEYQIPMEIFWNDVKRFKNYLNKINKLFGYKFHKFSTSCLFFDRYMVQAGWIPIKYERFVFESILMLLDGSGMTVKPHPVETKELTRWRYQDMPINIYEQRDIPWELVVLNYILRMLEGKRNDGFPDILMSANSTALLYTQSLLYSAGIQLPVIFINKILHPFLNEVEVQVEPALIRYTQIYKERKVYMPENWEQLYQQLSDLLPILVYDKQKVVEIKNRQTELLTKEYKKTLTTWGNLLNCAYCDVSYVSNNEDIRLTRYVTFYIVGEQEFTLYFSDFSVGMAENICVRILVAGSSPIFKRGKLHSVSYKKNNREEFLRIEKNFEINNRNPYLEFTLDALDARIEQLKVHIVTDQSYDVLNLYRLSQKYKNENAILKTWIEIGQSSEKFQNYLRKKQIKRIGIYGNNTVGKLMEQQLKKYGIATDMIDQKKLEGTYIPEEAVKNICRWDNIIVIPFYDFYNIHRFFLFSERVVGLDDFLKEVRGI